MSWLVELILNWLAGKLIAFLSAMKARAEAREKIKQDAAKSVEPLERAETAEQIDEAADEALNGL